MNLQSISSAALTVCVTSAIVAAQAPATPAPFTKSQSVTATATIQAIDATARTVTLRDEKGVEDTYTVSPDVQRFDELKVGDTVKMTYYEAVVFQVRKPGERPMATTGEAAVTRGTGALPSGTLAVQEKMTVTVKAIDPEAPSITVARPDGRTVIRKVDDKKRIEGLMVGDQIDITFTRAILTSIERK